MAGIFFSVDHIKLKKVKYKQVLVYLVVACLVCASLPFYIWGTPFLSVYAIGFAFIPCLKKG